MLNWLRYPWNKLLFNGCHDIPFDRCVQFRFTTKSPSYKNIYVYKVMVILKIYEHHWMSLCHQQYFLILSILSNLKRHLYKDSLILSTTSLFWGGKTGACDISVGFNWIRHTLIFTFTKCNSLQFIRKWSVIHSSIKTDRTEIYIPNLSISRKLIQRKVMDCTK